MNVYMEEALRLARKCGEAGEIPIGAVVVKRYPDGTSRIVGCGSNSRENGRNALGHAELSAINDACINLGGWRLCGCDMYVTLEPCPMCAGAAVNARIENIYFGAYDKKNGACGSVADIPNSGFTFAPNVIGGIMEDECSELLRQFFRRLRESRSGISVRLIRAETAEQLRSVEDMSGGIIPGFSCHIVSRNGKYIGYTAVNRELCRAEISLSDTAYEKETLLAMEKIYRSGFEKAADGRYIMIERNGHNG